MNPGPDSVESTTVSLFRSFEPLTNHLSILQLNIQSIVPKPDLIEGKAASNDVRVFSESWLKPEIPYESLHIETLSPPFRADRTVALAGMS